MDLAELQKTKFNLMIQGSHPVRNAHGKVTFEGWLGGSAENHGVLFAGRDEDNPQMIKVFHGREEKKVPRQCVRPCPADMVGQYVVAVEGEHIGTKFTVVRIDADTCVVKLRGAKGKKVPTFTLPKHALYSAP
jgi:hypothetical protein